MGTSPYRTITALLVISLIAVLSSCSGGDDPADDTITDQHLADVTFEGVDTPQETSATVETASIETAETLQDVPGEETAIIDTCTVQGVVMTPEGTPIEDAMLILCQEDDCAFAQSGADGSFLYEDVDARETALKIIGFNQEMISLTLPVGICPSTTIDLEEIVLTPLGEGEIITADTGGTAQAHPDVTLTLPAGCQFPNYETEREVIATEIPQEMLHAHLQQGPTPARAFALEPYMTELSGPSDITIAMQGYEETEATLYVLDAATGAWKAGATGLVDDEGILTFDGEGPDALTLIKLAFDTNP